MERIEDTAMAPRPAWAEYATMLGSDGPAYFVREVFDLRRLDRPHVAVDAAQFDRASPVVQVEVSAYGAPAQLEPEEARFAGAALSEAAALVEQAREARA